MKKMSLMVCAAAVLGTSLLSCDSISDDIGIAFTTNAVRTDFTLPLIPDTTSFDGVGAATIPFNMDSIVREETNERFGIQDVDRIEVQDMRFTILNPDAQNNAANFERIKLTLSALGSDPAVFEVANNPDVYQDTIKFPIQPNLNLKPYLVGNAISFALGGKARRATDKELRCRINMRLRIVK